MILSIISTDDIVNLNHATSISIKLSESPLHKIKPSFIEITFDGSDEFIKINGTTSIAIKSVKQNLLLLIGYLDFVLLQSFWEFSTAKSSRLIIVTNFKYSLKSDDSFGASLHYSLSEYCQQLVYFLRVVCLWSNMALDCSIFTQEHADEFLVVKRAALILVATRKDFLHFLFLILETEFFHGLIKLFEFDMANSMCIIIFEHFDEACLLSRFISSFGLELIL